jgi:hypothetical protein
LQELELRSVGDEFVRDLSRHTSLAQQDEAVVLAACSICGGPRDGDEVRFASRGHEDRGRDIELRT